MICLFIQNKINHLSDHFITSVVKYESFYSTLRNLLVNLNINYFTHVENLTSDRFLVYFLKPGDAPPCPFFLILSVV